MYPTLAHLSDDILRPIAQLLASTDEAIHCQGLELLEALTPAGPGAMRGAVIRNPSTDLTARDLSGARILRNFRPSNLQGVCLLGGTIRTSLTRLNFTGADLRFSRIHCSWNRIHSARFQLAGACLRGAILKKANMRGLDMHIPGLVGMDIRGVDLSDADLRGGRFSELDLSGADLTGANLKGTNLKNTRLVGADLSGANLFRVNLKGADLTGASLTFDETIRWDATTRWPAGLAPAPGTRPSREHPRYRARRA